MRSSGSYWQKKRPQMQQILDSNQLQSSVFSLPSTGLELLALYNNPPVREGQVKYYTVKVPLRVQSYEEGIKGVEANWLDHMTQHFNNGASLVDGYFYLGNGKGIDFNFKNKQPICVPLFLKTSISRPLVVSGSPHYSWFFIVC